MKDWIPLLQTLVWPLLIVGILYWARDKISRFLQVIIKRIEEGNSFEVGTSSFKLKIPSSPLTEYNDNESIRKAPIPNNIYLVHQSKRDRGLDKNDLQYYRLRIWLDADTPELLDEVASVEYHLHPTFTVPDRIVKDRDSNFALVTVAWGEFNMSADVKFKGGRDPLILNRYINL